MPIRTKGYLATDAQVASLAKDYVTHADGSEQARGTYLRILVAHAQRELSKSDHKRHSAAESLGAIETAHAHLYGVVLEAITTPDIALVSDASDVERKRRAQERNRRSTFARSSKSALAGFVKAGGRLASLIPDDVTRDQLTKFTREAREGPVALPDRVETTAKRLETLVKQLMAEDPDAAKTAVEALSWDLQAIVTPPKQMRGTRKVGEMTLRAEA